MVEEEELEGAALVTGGCSGIGRAIAEELAARGHSLLLVSDRSSEVSRSAAEIRTRYGVAVHALSLDLARPDAATELHDATRKLGLEIEVLVNNAGFFFFGEAADAEPARARAMLQLHVVTPSLLCTLFGRDMRARGRGHILIVSSVSAWRDLPGISYYGSSKKYLRGFASALRSELQPHGVNVTCLAPGATDTALYGPDVVAVELARRLGLMLDAREVAAEGVRALFERRAEIVPGRLARVMASGAALTPQWLVDLARRRAPWLPRGNGAR